MFGAKDRGGSEARLQFMAVESHRFARRDSLRLPLSFSLRLIVVLNEKLLEVMSDDVTQDQARALASGTPTTC